jgi:2-hydroxychromene-2-carboxylate isomerase
MAKSFEFWFDIGSPAAYLAWTQLPAVCAETGAQAVYRPMLLGGVFHATGNHSPTSVPAKGSYMLDDLARFARRYGVPFNNNPNFPVNTLMIMRGAVGLQLREPARFDAYVRAMYEAMWVNAKNLNDPATIGAVLHAAGFDPAALLALTQDAEVKDRLKAVTQEAVDRGVFGAPVIFVGTQMFWGQDRLDFVKEALQ